MIIERLAGAVVTLRLDSTQNVLILRST